jgi:hypothetical protein
MRFVYLDSRFTLHASFPRSVTLAQLRFTSLAVASSREDLHLQDRAHAGRTIRKGRFARPFSAVSWVTTLSNP